MRSGPSPPASRDRVPALVAACGIAVTLAVAWLLGDGILQRQHQEFDAAASQAQETILAKVETSIALLRGTAGLFISRQEELVSVEDFAAYVSRLDLRERYPGILGIGFAQRIEKGGEAALAARMVVEGHAGFRVWPEPGPGERTAITFIEPLDHRNQAAVGYDMATDPVRREAMERARDLGASRVSGAVELVQEIEANKQPGFLIYMPVYRARERPTTLEERRATLAGYVYAPIRAVDFLSRGFRHEQTPRVGMAVYSGSRESGTLLYQRGKMDPDASFALERTAEVAGQPWTFSFRAQATRSEVLAMPAAVAAVGIALSLLLAVLVRRERRAHAAAQQSLAAERAARAEAERANRMKDEFLATLSHELRTPLHAIIGWTSLLRQPALREEQRRQGIDVVERNARAQARLIEDLLDMSRITAGKVALEMQPVDFCAVVADVAASVSPQAEAKGVRLRNLLCAEPLTVRGDPARLQQVVANLLSNALKFTPPGGEITVRLERDAGRARLCVKDSGEGIEPEFLERLFVRFSQADGSVTRRHGGLGLGLAIVRQLVELHGGSVRARSEGRGHGAEFVVEIPLAVPATRDDDSGAERSAGETLSGIHVLAVDDDADSRELVRAVLASRGAEVRVAASAAEALEALRAAPPDVLLSDVGMPGTDGYALIRTVRALPPAQGGRVPAAALTAYVRDEDRASALEAGFDAHVAKPVHGDSLVQTVASLAARNRA